MLGQDQDSLRGRMTVEESVKGVLANANVWDSVLEANEINELSKSCKAEKTGNVQKWEDFLHGVKGNTAVVIPYLPVSPDSAELLGTNALVEGHWMAGWSSRKDERLSFIGKTVLM